MKTTAFSSRQMSVDTHDAHGLVVTVVVPTLSAFAIEHGDFEPPPHVDLGRRVLHFGTDFTIDGDKIWFTTPLSLFFDSFELSRLVIHYHGIRDYTLLFPQVTEPALKARLGRFYEEAEVTFDNGAWLSFALMAAAVYEGLLGQRLDTPKKGLSDLIGLAAEEGILTAAEERILQVARESRNLVHAGLFAKPCVTRAHAMDMRTVMDTLVRKFANLALQAGTDSVAGPVATSGTTDVSRAARSK